MKAEQPGMKRLARKGHSRRAGWSQPRRRAAGAAAVNRVADQRMAVMRQMHTDLVGPASQQPALDQCRERNALGAESALDPIAGHRRLAAGSGDDRHLLAVRRAAPDIAGDLAGGRHRHAPHKGAVGALDPAPRKIARQGTMHEVGLGGDEETARVLVETVDDPRPTHPTYPGEAWPAM